MRRPPRRREGAPHQRAPHQRPDPRPRGPARRPQRRAGRHRPHRATRCGWPQEADLDLVEVAPMARPPVCKLMDYGKFKYEIGQKAREARRNQTNTVIKEMKLRPKIDPHDYETKKGHVVRFLKAGDKVKITIMFRGREQSPPRAGLPAAAAAGRGRRGARLRRVRAQAGRPQHDHGARPAQEEGRGQGRAAQGRARRGRDEAERASAPTTPAAAHGRASQPPSA